jgi:bifunctional non-homologous end joining protein LigD
MPIADIEGRRVVLGNLDKVLYPAVGFTKGEAVHHYATVAGCLLPHLAGRPLSFLRFPDGVEGQRFFAKHVPPGTPEWVTTCEVRRTDGRRRSNGEDAMVQVMIEDLPSLVWAANLAALELHTPQWRVADEGRPDRLVLDLDPGPGASVLDCREVAFWLRERLASDGLEAMAKTSGAKGLHLLAAVEPSATASAVSAYAKRLAQEAEAALPRLALHRMARHLRAGKVFVDHSQNAWAKTTAAPYTLRAQERPTVSAPVTWDELADAGSPDDVVVLAGDMAERLAVHGDLLAPLLDPARAARLP